MTPLNGNGWHTAGQGEGQTHTMGWTPTGGAQSTRTSLACHHLRPWWAASSQHQKLQRRESEERNQTTPTKEQVPWNGRYLRRIAWIRSGALCSDYKYSITQPGLDLWRGACKTEEWCYSMYPWVWQLDRCHALSQERCTVNRLRYAVYNEPPQQHVGLRPRWSCG